jgi:tRNA modification GTPase
MDLTRAEAIADLVADETEAQRKLALQQYDGALADLYQQWRGQLIRAAAWIEAAIDFPDEEIPENTWSDSRSTLTALKRQLLAHLNDQRRGEIVREGFQIAVIGPPNAGKSSLVNALARRDVAIVSDIPGTTRDIIEVKLDLGGYAVVLADTAGLRQSLEPIEQEGVRRALARAEAADFRLVVQDATADQTGLEGDLVIHNKADLVESRQPDELYISAKTGEGLDELVRVLTAKAAERMSVGEAPLLTRARHRHAVERAAAEIGAAMDEREPELAAERLRRAMRHLGRITGAVDLDELLDVVFRDFCIGK